ncbi:MULTISPECIES: DUF3486 family protein [Acetobacter]|uniref:Mu-Like Prophage FluMu n=1 Tax=Acetobacter pomorum DM001 TaxID=945681 RepID=F1YRJ0_9PROT|nr:MULTISPECIES: DUF3486 family protein [Acetobacter]ATI11057.1 DUF3486 domain-containing protein [Acetobacter pomorum]AXC26603.1 DUF3486 family protein [Acetobacter sp. JWB]EGE48595.1 Mu-Like Prophage FluMu [Acetobacter pomorum DM001]KAA8386038.1 DUF3486 family protein [Acetobacter sp. DmW_136]KAA8420362.1 DUF3486 family protein [Acetobacter pomorum]
MARPSSIDQLEPEIRDEIGRLRGNGHTLDEILAALRELDVTHISRSALGRHVQSMEKIGAKLRHSRNIAEALVRQLGGEPASRSAQLNIELLHSAVLDLFLAAQNAEGGKPDGRGIAALNGNPEGIMMLAKALDHLTKSAKSDIENQKAIEERVERRLKAQAEKHVVSEAKKRGISAETARALMQGAFGVNSNDKKS